AEVVWVGGGGVVGVAGAFEKAECDAPVWAGGHRRDDTWVGEGLGVALALQPELLLVHAARHVRGEHQKEIGVRSRAHRLGPASREGGKQYPGLAAREADALWQGRTPGDHAGYR